MKRRWLTVTILPILALIITGCDSGAGSTPAPTKGSAKAGATPTPDAKKP